MARHQVELALWGLKDAGWQLYHEVWWLPGIPELVAAIINQANNQLRNIGCDPQVLVRHSTKEVENGY